mgnify:CR=1 FL=1
MVRVKRIVYSLFEVSRLNRWKSYLQIMYGLPLQSSQLPNEYEASVDDTGCRLLFREGSADDVLLAGWECDDLDGLKAQLEHIGAATEWASATYAATRGATRLLRTNDPTGMIIEIVDTTKSNHAFVPADHDHVYDAACAEMKSKGKRLSHFQLEVPHRNQVGLAYDRIRRAGIGIAHPIGVHPNDNQMSFYASTPSGFQSELGAASDLVTDGREVTTFYGISVWGHAMPLAEKLRTLRRAWPMLFNQKLGKT